MRRPSSSRTVMVRPSTSIGVADLGQPAELGQHVAGDGLVRPVGQPQAGRLGEVVEVEQPVDLARAAGRLPALGRDLRVVLVVDLADDLLDEVLEGDDAVGAAVLVDDDRQVLVLPAHLAERGEHARRAGQPLDLAGEVADGRGPAGRVVGQEQVADVHEADDVVLVAAGHREARPVGVGDLLGRPAGRRRGVEERRPRCAGSSPRGPPARRRGRPRRSAAARRWSATRARRRGPAAPPG